MGVRVSGTAAFVLSVLLAAAVPGYAQSPAAPAPAAPLPSPGFVPPYEIMRTVRAAGFDPLAPPLREGATYVLRATDFNGILMRVVIDARTGAIRDANRIVPGPGNYGAEGQLGMVAPDDAAPDLMPGPYRLPPQFGAPEMTPAVQPPPPPALQPSPKRHAKHVVPLPRARPAKVAAHKSGDDAKPTRAGDRTPPSNSGAEVAAPIAPTAKSGRASPSAIND